jgi:hypothetical protein
MHNGTGRSCATNRFRVVLSPMMCLWLWVVIANCGVEGNLQRRGRVLYDSMREFCRSFLALWLQVVVRESPMRFHGGELWRA